MYTKDSKVVQGPYDFTSSTSGEFWSSIFEGYDEVVVELDASPGVFLSDVVLTLNFVNSGYRGFVSKLPGRPGQSNGHGGSRELSGTCNVDVICPVADGWRDEVRQRNEATLLRFMICVKQRFLSNHFVTLS